MSEKVNHPPHYNAGKIEVIEFIEDQKLDYHSGNSIKYICRAGRKDAAKLVEDLEKAIWYLKRKLETLRAAPRRPNEMNPKTEISGTCTEGNHVLDKNGICTLCTECGHPTNRVVSDLHGFKCTLCGGPVQKSSQNSNTWVTLNSTFENRAPKCLHVMDRTAERCPACGMTVEQIKAER